MYKKRGTCHSSITFKRIHLYHPRLHGTSLSEGVFLICPEDGVDVFHIEPLAYANSPEAIRERMVADRGDRIGIPLAGGIFCPAFFEFTFLRIGREEIPILFRRLFLTLEAEGRTRELDPYLGAEVSVGEKSLSLTVKDLILAPGSRPH